MMGISELICPASGPEYFFQINLRLHFEVQFCARPASFAFVEHFAKEIRFKNNAEDVFVLDFPNGSIFIVA